jgi:hypothetical protein
MIAVDRSDIEQLLEALLRLLDGYYVVGSDEGFALYGPDRSRVSPWLPTKLEAALAGTSVENERLP